MIHFIKRFTRTLACLFLCSTNSYLADVHFPTSSKWENYKKPLLNCSDLQFQCNNVQYTEERFYHCNNGACIEKLYKCDGVKQCCDGSDELLSICNKTVDNTRKKRDVGGHCTAPIQSAYKSITYECDNLVANSKSCFVNGLVRESTVAKVVCNSDYLTLNDSNTNHESVCRKSIWYPPIEKCYKKCDKLTRINVDIKCYRNNKQISCDENLLIAGDRVYTTCKPVHHKHTDFEPSYDSIVCRDDGKWDKPLFTCSPICGRPFTNALTLISNGAVEHFGDSPWHVAIYDKDKILICGGTIIHPLLILTAAHCFFNEENNHQSEDLDNFEVVVSKVNRTYSAKDNKYQKVFKIREIRLDTRGFFSLSNYYAADVALLILKEQLTLSPTVLPACIDAEKTWYPPEDTLGKVVGWGKNEHDKLNEQLHTANLPFISRQRCFKMVPEDFYPYITLDKFCAGSQKGAAVLQGDSGGGLMFEENGSFFIRGIVSIKQPTKTSIAAFTDLADHVNWILNIRDQIENEMKDYCAIPESYPDKTVVYICPGEAQDDSCKRNSETVVTEFTKAIFTCKPKYYHLGKFRMQSICLKGSWVPEIFNCENIDPKLGTKHPNERFYHFDNQLLVRKFALQRKENIALSPANIKIMLATLLEGGDTGVETLLKTALRLPEDKTAALTILRSQFNSLQGFNSAGTVQLANKIYVSSTENISKRYRDILLENYHLPIEYVNFAKRNESYAQILDWQVETTRNSNPIITKDDIDITTRILLANYIHFRGDWKFVFRSKSIFTDDFYKNNFAVPQKSKFMTAEIPIKYQENKFLNAEVAEIPFKDERYTLTILLPNERSSVLMVMKNLVNYSLMQLFPKLEDLVARVTLPITSIECRTPLADILTLSEIYLKNTFILESNTAIPVKNIFHVVKIEIAEGKNITKSELEAGSCATSKSPGTSNFSLEFKVDRSFIFFIRDTYESGIFLEGIVLSP